MKRAAILESSISNSLYNKAHTIFHNVERKQNAVRYYVRVKHLYNGKSLIE